MFHHFIYFVFLYVKYYSFEMDPLEYGIHLSKAIAILPLNNVYEERYQYPHYPVGYDSIFSGHLLDFLLRGKVVDQSSIAAG